MTNSEWASSIVVLRAVWPMGFDLDATAISAWFDALRDLSGEKVAAAIWTLAKTRPSFPGVADIRQLAEPVKPSPLAFFRLRGARD